MVFKYLSINKTKTTIFLIIGIIIGSSIGVYAVNKLSSNQVLYDNNNVTSAANVKEALDELFIKAKTKTLADVVSIGDYVVYDAGTWNETVAKPTSQGQFGGYKTNESKANIVNCGNGSTSLKGWRVLSFNKDNNTVTIVHASSPECYYHYAGSGRGTASVISLNDRAVSEYLNSDYANSGHMLNYGEANAMDSAFRVTSSYYCLASAVGTDDLYFVWSDGIIRSYGNGPAVWSVRPVVVLKPNIKTTGKIKDAVGNDAWNLIAP